MLIYPAFRIFLTMISNFYPWCCQSMVLFGKGLTGTAC